MRARLITLVLLMMTLMSAALVQAETISEQITHDGRVRDYLLYVPDSYTPDTPMPLLIALHPAGGGAAGMAAITGFNEIAEREGFIVLYPIGPYEYWDYGANLPAWSEVVGVLDDPGYIEAALDQVMGAYSIDSARVYAVGYSNGARMAYRLGCDLHDRIAAIATVAATISDEITAACPADARVSVFFMHGTADSVIPWRGKPLHLGSLFIANALSAPSTAQFWAARNGCYMSAVRTDEPDADPTDRVTMQRDTYSSACDHGTEVVFYRVNNGGHGWTNADNFPTSETIWAFFAAHPME